MIEKLIQRKIRFRWEIPHGVSFIYENKKWLKNTLGQMHDFLTMKMREPDKLDKSGKAKKTKWDLNL